MTAPCGLSFGTGSTYESDRHPCLRKALNIVHALTRVMVSAPASQELGTADAHRAARDSVEGIIGHLAQIARFSNVLHACWVCPQP